MILPMKNKIYVCGTGAMSPVAYYLDVSKTLFLPLYMLTPSMSAEPQ